MQLHKPRVRGILASCLVLSLGGISYGWSGSFGGTIDAKAIVEYVDQILRGESSMARVEMAVKTRRWERAMTLEILSEGNERALVKVLAPKKEEGTATLKVESDIWNYLPKIDRTIRVPTSMMMASWMGSHFTNDDIVKESRLVRDYEIDLSFDGARDGLSVYEITLIPRPAAPVVWGKILIRVRKEDRMPLWSKYYAEDGSLKRTMFFSDFQTMDGRLVPSVLRMEPADKTGEFTEVRYHQLDFDVPIPKGTFTLASLRK